MHDAVRFLSELVASSDDLFSAGTVATWPAGYFEELVAQDLLIPSTPAGDVVCDACSDQHVEEVIYVESPPGSGRRAYIKCPDAGRVSVDMERLCQWAANIDKLKALTGWKPPSEQVEVQDPIQLTITEAARFVGVTDRTIRQWRNDGKLTVIEAEDGSLTFSKSTLEILRKSR